MLYSSSPASAQTSGLWGDHRCERAQELRSFLSSVLPLSPSASHSVIYIPGRQLLPWPVFREGREGEWIVEVCRQPGKGKETSAQLVWAFAILPRQVLVMKKGGIYLPLPSFLWLLYSAVLQINYCLEKEWLWQAASPASWPSRSGRREHDELLSQLCGP